MSEISCKICGSFDIKPWFKNNRRILRCQSCDMVFLSPVLIKYNPEKYYENAEHYNRIASDKAGLESIVAIAKKSLKIILKYLKPNGKSLLDIGAHTGMLVKEATRLGFTAMGIDLNEIAVKEAKNRGISVYKGAAENFESADQFDIICAIHVLEHSTDPIKALQNIKRLLSKGGYLAIGVPDVGSYFAKKYGIFWRHIDLEHLFYFSKKSLSEILENLDFKVVAVKNNVFELEYEWGIKKICRYIIGKEKRNGFITKADFIVRATELNEENIIVKFTKRLIKHLLIVFITLFGLADNVLIIARKNQT